MGRKRKNKSQKRHECIIIPPKGAPSIDSRDWLDQGCPAGYCLNAKSIKDFNSIRDKCKAKKLKTDFPNSSEYMLVIYPNEKNSWIKIPPKSRANAPKDPKRPPERTRKPSIVKGETASKKACDLNSSHIDDTHIVPGEGPHPH